MFSFCPLLRINFRTLVASGALAPLSACPLQLPGHHRVSQLKSNLTKFQYAISVRLKLKPNEQDKYQSAVFQFVIVVSVGVFERAERTLPTRCVPRSSLIRRQPARLSYRGPPQPAPELCGSRRCSEGPGWSVAGGTNLGETQGKRHEGPSRAGPVRASLRVLPRYTGRALA